MVDFNAMKKNRGANLAALTEKLNNMNGGSAKKVDERIYKPGFDKKEGKGYAVVRFLPNKVEQTFVQRYSFAFKGKGGWYIENSLATIGSQDDPVAISNRLYWNKGTEEGNENLLKVAKGRKRKETFYSNVYVVRDTINPANEGKVMIFEFGPQIWKIIEKAIKPEFEGDEPLDPWDMWSGADFRIKIVGKEIPDQRNPGQKVIVPSYESSEFAAVSEFLRGDEAALKEVFEKTFDLSDFVKVKSREELVKQFIKVTGEAPDALENPNAAAQTTLEKLEEQSKLEEDQDNSSPVKEVKETVVEDDEPQVSDPENSEEEDDVLAMFRQMKP